MKSVLVRTTTESPIANFRISNQLPEMLKTASMKPEYINLFFSADIQFRIQLEHYSLLADNFRLRVGTDQGIQDDLQPLAATFKGSIVDDPGSAVRLTAADNYFAGFIRTGTGDQYSIEMGILSVSEPESEPVSRLYRIVPGESAGLVRPEDYSPAPDWYPAVEDRPGRSRTNVYSDSTIYEAEIALIADYAAYAKVNSTGLLANELLNILNYADAYYNQLNIVYRLVEIFIFTSVEAESWPDTDDAGVLLSAVDQWVADGGLSNWHDLATFWTGRNFGYSYAWLNTIGDYGRHHLVEFGGLGDTRWLANFQAHEAGHNWGAPHVEHDPRWIMSPAIYDGVINWHSSTVDAFPDYISRALEHLIPVDSVTTPAFLFHQPLVTNDDNQDGIPDPGESFTVQLQVENIGTGTSGNTIVNLNLGGPGSEWATLVGASDTVGAMHPFVPITASHDLSLDQNIPIPNKLYLNYSISDGTVSGTAAFVLSIGRVPAYHFSVAGVADDGNSNGKFDPGESVLLLLDIENRGEVSGWNIGLSVQPAVDVLPYIRDLDSIQIIERLDPDEHIQSEIAFGISSDFPMGTELELIITLSDSFNFEQQERSFVVGTPAQHLYWEDFEYFGLGLPDSDWQQQNATELAITVQYSIGVHDEDNGDWVSGPYAGQRSLFAAENWVTSGPVAIRIITPQIDLRSAKNPELNFKEIRGWDNYWPQRKTEHEIRIESATSSTGPWTTLTSVRAYESNFRNWQNVEKIDLSALVGEQIFLSFFTDTHHYYWRIDNISVIDSGLAQTEDFTGPLTFKLAQNYPNPFNSITTIRYNLPAPGKAILTVYDITGQEVKKLVNKPQSAGDHDIQWHGTNHSGNPVSVGVYFCRMQAGDSYETIKLVYLK
ncbi:MAG: FlgD immunoglobulin-like domain containing protein [Candidatus Neomarinimicrobiota bacterium]